MRARWAWTTLAAAGAATALDAVLLQLRRSFFSGGFLAVDHVSGVAEGVTYLALSLLTDAAVAGVIVALALWGASRLRLSRAFAVGAALVLALAPIAIADFVSYQLASYLGDAFDLSLMFDLAGRSPAELLAVSSAHLPRTLGAIAVLGGAVAASIWIWGRRATTGGPVDTTRLRHAMVLPCAVLVLGATLCAIGRLESDVLDNGLRRKPAGQVIGAAIDWLTDVDGDGVGALDAPPDPDLTNSRIRPYALDMPGNGVDEDGVGGDLPADTQRYVEAAPAAGEWHSTRDVVLFVLESFRFDARGASYRGTPITPVLDALAARGVSVEYAFSPNGYTVQSRRHIFSGSVADVRGATTLLDDFKARGYETAYFSGQDESFGGAAGDVGFSRADVAYDARVDRDRRYTTFTTAGSLAVPWTIVRDRVQAFLDARRSTQPLFLYVNFEDTHFPYHHPAIQPLIASTFLTESQLVPGRRDAVRATYLNTAANVDRAIGDVLDRVRHTRGGTPAVVVLADHGESLFDEGFLGHGYALNDAQTRIPLIVADLPAVIEEPFSQADLRDIIDHAMAAPPAAAPVPVVRRNPARAVFQYLGTFDRPRQIGLTTMSGRVVYDFRSRCVSVDAGSCGAADRAAGATRSALQGLARTWERMMLARHHAADGGD